MPIAALSEKAARAICSTLVLNDAISVIKELIDNALDANASNIVIELSANTLDIIQIKDNGTGIGVEDRQLLCKQGFTSKIRTFEDLAQLGGTFLGFRGEALASVAGLSDSVTFTTRVDGETVGTLLKFDSNGKLVSSSSAAHGTGTTVRVSEFLKSIPVRRQTALKQAPKTLNNVKRLLFDYAFARPTVRFQFKVLKSGGDLKANWSFAPCKDASNLNILASKIAGKDVAAQCEQATISSEDGGYKIDALLFTKDADISKCGGSDRFVSIDGRPLTVERGLMKELNKTYKSYISSVLPDGVVVPNKVFLLLRLDFPRGSYDVNVEPAKNEVIFEDSGLVLDLFERLCKQTYGEKSAQLSTRKDASKTHINPIVDFEVLLAKKTPSAVSKNEPKESPNSTTSLEGEELQDASSDAGVIKPKVFRSMYGVDEQDLLSPQDEDHNVPEIDEEAEDVMDPKVTNPFVLAKVNTLVKPGNMSDQKGITKIVQLDTLHQTAVHREAQDFASRSDRRADLLPSPSPSPERNTSYQNPGPPNRPWKSRQIRDETNHDDVLSPVSLQHTLESGKPTLLDNWTKSVNSSSPQQDSPTPIELRRSEPINMPARAAIKTASNALERQTPSKRLTGVSSTHQSAFRTPFKRTLNVESSSPIFAGQSIAPQAANNTMRQTESPSPAEIHSLKFPGFERPRLLPDTELEDIMDFEHRKRSTILEHRERTRQSRSDKDLRRDEQTHDEETFSVPARPEKEGLSLPDQDATYGSKFGQVNMGDSMDILAQSKSASHIQNPHLNRRNKALRELDDRTEKQNIRDKGDHIIEQREAGEDAESYDGIQTESSVKLSPRDPRAYLIRLSNEKGLLVQGNSSKSKKPMLARLPFETIDPTVATYKYTGPTGSAVPEDIQLLPARVKVLGQIDPYVRNGTISSEISQGGIAQDVIGQWEKKIQCLLDDINTIGSDVPQDGTNILTAK